MEEDLLRLSTANRHRRATQLNPRYSMLFDTTHSDSNVVVTHIRETTKNIRDEDDEHLKLRFSAPNTTPEEEHREKEKKKKELLSPRRRQEEELRQQILDGMKETI